MPVPPPFQDERVLCAPTSRHCDLIGRPEVGDALDSRVRRVEINRRVAHGHHSLYRIMANGLVNDIQHDADADHRDIGVSRRIASVPCFRSPGAGMEHMHVGNAGSSRVFSR